MWSFLLFCYCFFRHIGYDGDQENVTEIQINFLPNVTAEDYLNQRVTVKGTVMFGHTGHHLTTVILMDAEIEQHRLF